MKKTDLVIEKLSPITLEADQASVFEKRIAIADEELPTIGDAVRAPLSLWKPPPRPEYERLKCNDHTFVFKYDQNDPEILHIYARHMTTPDDAFVLYFNEDAIWDEERERYGNFSDTHGLYWCWCNKEKE